jgi:pimeloyl-ACP methyl ester carboxylesterase
MSDWGQLPRMLAADSEFRALCGGASVQFALSSVGEDQVVLSVDNGDIDLGDDPLFTVELEPESWAQLLADRPVVGAQHMLAHITPRGSGQVTGDRLAFAQHLHLIRRAVEVLAGICADGRVTGAPDLSSVTGRYVRVTVEPWGTLNIAVEQAGVGKPVVMLHTAGADSSQYHGLLGLARRFPGRQLIAFDLPWHGRSSPPAGQLFDYTLTSESYSECVATVIAALELSEPPILVGASMAGAAVLEVAARYPDVIGGAIGCQVGPRVKNRHNEWLRSPRVNQALFVPEWTFGLMSPISPRHDRERVWWGYSQGGYGVYERDISYYTKCWDIENIKHLLTEQSPPIVLMSGSYDYSVPSAATKELADQIPGAIFREMGTLGHFPHAENPTAFADHLGWALSAIEASQAPSSSDH